MAAPAIVADVRLIARMFRHTSCPRGKKVLLILHDGTRIVGKFHDRTQTHVELEGRRVAKRDIRTFSLYNARL
jgi:hypothetical protein